MYENILFEKVGKIGWITINRPSFLNALNKQTISELNQVLGTVSLDEEIGVVCITGSGDKAFVAGADIKEFAEYTVSQGGELAASGQEKLFNLLENLTKPTIAVINGFALGGGLELAMACHIRIASANARMGLPEVSLGVIPGYGGTQRLPQLIGRGRANQLIFTGEMISADQASQWGLLNTVVEQSVLKDEANALAYKMLKNSPNAIATAIKAVNAGFQTQDGLNTEIELFASCFGTNDFHIGTQAFLTKQKANFRD
jgi:enoyl-CoA hydratase